MITSLHSDCLFELPVICAIGKVCAFAEALIFGCKSAWYSIWEVLLN